MDKEIKLVIFDLDGTILDTLEDLADSTNYALTTNGYRTRTIEEVRQFVGNGIGKLIERALPEGTGKSDVQRVLDTFKEYYGEHCTDKTGPYDGIIELITYLKDNAYKTAVVSNKADFAVQTLCSDYFPDMFDYVSGEKEGIRRKPYPDTVNKVLEMLDVKAENAIYIGDSDVDIKTAQNAGMNCISVTWGFRDRDFLKENGGEIFADTPEDIKKIIKNGY